MEELINVVRYFPIPPYTLQTSFKPQMQILTLIQTLTFRNPFISANRLFVLCLSSAKGSK